MRLRLVPEIVAVDALTGVRLGGADTDVVVDISAARRSPSTRTTRGDTVAAYSRASLLKADAVNMTPFDARAPWSAPTKACTVGRPTVASHRLAWTYTTSRPSLSSRITPSIPASPLAPVRSRECSVPSP